MGAVLGLMRRSGAVTGTDLIKATGLARATVIAVCDDLIKAGWVRELPAQKTAAQKGRPARVFEFDARAGVVVGLDFGVAKATAVVADLRGTILAKTTEPLPGFAAPDAERLASINKALRRALARAGVKPEDVLVAGVGIAAPVDRRGNISRSQAFWEHLDIGLQDDLRARYGWPVLLGNDANLAAMAERWMGVGAGFDDLAVMLAGDRIGFGLIESGRLLHGAAGRSGEMGLLQLVDGVGTPDGIAVLAREMGIDACRNGSAATVLSTLARANGSGLAAEDVFSAAAGGDEVAAGILDGIARRMARVIALAATLVDPELVVIGGAVAQASEVLLEPLQQELAGLMPNPPRVAVSPLGDAIVTLGAVRLALDYVESRALDLVLGA
ncbi:ROK family protein [Paeniglutamicibacter psychrophenolicus]|uniref:NBD/HSP70 family sugar kinase n=1 Tax=Paeniglutamicibacter psychrophenolicus TaxID=257454 RepID=A0ABS4WF19_9MICC|nr:ROK family protein [Paeniglutamicibacter psychrophenolicus]MBP2374812.1 putative NBD/HSP70 family sugar kinase [Paeniglutamicibacter psychrophenolicus]